MTQDPRFPYTPDTLEAIPSYAVLGSGVASDSVDLTFVSKAISIAVAGDIKVTLLGGQTIVIPSGSLAAGGQHLLRITRLWSTGTAATGIVLYY